MAGLKNRFRMLAFFGAAAVVFSSCSHPVTDTLYKEILAKKSARISDDIPAKYCIDKEEQITFVFTESMDPSTVKMSGSIFEDQKEILWRETNLENDTLIFKPKTQWHVDPEVEGGDRASLYVSGMNRDGYVSKNIEWKPVVLDGIIYVDEKSRKEKNDTNYSVTGLGSAEHPLPSLTEAILSYKALYDGNKAGEIHVRGGEYDTLMNNSNIKVENSLIIKGGYDSSDWNIQAPEKNTTILKGIENLRTDNPCTIEVGRNAKLLMNGVKIYSSCDSDLKFAVCISGRQNSIIELNNCILEAVDSENMVKEIEGIFSRGQVILNDSRINLRSEVKNILLQKMAPENSFGIFVLETDKLEIQNSIINLYRNSTKNSIAVYAKDFLDENTVNITNSIIYNSSPAFNNSYMALVQLENVKAENISSNTFGMNCGSTKTDDTALCQNIGVNVINGSKIQNCCGNIFYNQNSTFENHTFGINLDNQDDINKCKSNCFIAMKTLCFKISGTQSMEYTPFGLESEGIGFYIGNPSTVSFTSGGISEPLKPQSNSPFSILYSDLENTVTDTDIRGKLRTAPYTLGAYEID